MLDPIDAEIITQALLAYRRLAFRFRYGGMGRDYQRAQAALKAWARIQKEREPVQLELEGENV
jgi:hypothetical protein